MATLDPGNIVNGNTIETNDILQLYQAFGTGSGASITGLAMTGSLYGNALTATTATTATSASNITTAITGGGAWYPAFVVGSGTKAPKIDNNLSYDADNKTLSVTSSYATTASYALTTAPQSPTYDNVTLTNSSNPPGSEYVINPLSKDILFIENSGGPIGFSFTTGTEGQMIKFTTAFKASAIDLANISITASTSPVNFFNATQIATTPPTNMNTMNNVFTAPGNILWSFDFYYTGGEWYLITPFAQ